jgi:hypothetical protein
MQADRVEVFAYLQVECLAGQPGLAAGEDAAREFYRAVGGERAAVGGGQHRHVALQGRQLQRVDLPGGLAVPVVPIAGALQQFVAEIGVQLDRAVEQGGRVGAGFQAVVGRAAAQLQAHIAQRRFRQAVLLVEPAHRAFAKVDVALREELVQEGAVGAGGRLHLDAAHRQGAGRVAADQHVGVAGVQYGERHLPAQQ